MECPDKFYRYLISVTLYVITHSTSHRMYAFWTNAKQTPEIVSIYFYIHVYTCSELYKIIVGVNINVQESLP